MKTPYVKPRSKLCGTAYKHFFRNRLTIQTLRFGPRAQTRLGTALFCQSFDIRGRGVQVRSDVQQFHQAGITDRPTQIIQDHGRAGSQTIGSMPFLLMGDGKPGREHSV